MKLNLERDIKRDFDIERSSKYSNVLKDQPMIVHNSLTSSILDTI